MYFFCSMEFARQWLLRGVNGVRQRLGDRDVEQEVQLKQIRYELGELRQEVGQLHQSQTEKLERIEQGVHQNGASLQNLLKTVDRALAPRWRGVLLLAGASVATTIVIMLMVF